MHPLVWLARAAWIAAPACMIGAIDAALDGASTAVATVAVVGLWGGWMAGLVALVIARTTSLTAIRVLAPGALAVAVACVLGDRSGADALALSWAVVTFAAVFAPHVSAAFVDGSSYGDERRLPLRVPPSLVLGPVELAWLVLAAGVATGPLLLAAQQWIAGALGLAAGAPAAYVAAQRLHTLSRRWLVFVPNGVVVHDPLRLAEPVLFRRGTVRSLGPAPADSDGLDLTLGALGLALELTLGEPVDLALRDGRGAPRMERASRLLVTPTLPGETLRVAAERRLPVGAAR